MYVSLKQPHGDGERYVTPARAAAKETRSGSVIQDLSGSWYVKGTDKPTLVMDSPVPLMQHDPGRSWITDPDPDHPKGTYPIRGSQWGSGFYC